MSTFEMEARRLHNFDEKEEKIHELIMGKFKESDSMTDQMEWLYKSLRLTPCDTQQRDEVCHLVQRILRVYFPLCTVLQYGSSANGLGMRGCDLDLRVDFHEGKENDQKWFRTCFDEGTWEFDYQSDEPEFVYKPPWRPPTVQYCLNGTWLCSPSLLIPAQIRQMSPLDLVKTVHRMLGKHQQHFAEFSVVNSKRHPIVRFCHVSTGISCDLSVRDPSVLQNTELLKLYASDTRTRLLLFTVRYWAKRKQLVNTRDTTHKLSNYCLSMLVLYYLASECGAGLLPPVHKLQELAERRQKKDGVKRNLPDHLPDTTAGNQKTLEELLLGFFNCWVFRVGFLKSYVLLTQTASFCSPWIYTACHLSEGGYDYVKADFIDKPLAVADPFLINKNIAIGVNAATRDLFVDEMQEAARKLFGHGSSLVDLFSNVRPRTVAESLRHIYHESAHISPEDVRRNRNNSPSYHNDSVNKICPLFVAFALLCLALSPTPKSGLYGILAYLVFCLCADYCQRKVLAYILRTLSCVAFVRAVLWFFVFSLAYYFFEPFLIGAAPELVGACVLVVYGSFFGNLVLVLWIGRGLRNFFSGA